MRTIYVPSPHCKSSRTTLDVNCPKSVKARLSWNSVHCQKFSCAHVRSEFAQRKHFRLPRFYVQKSSAEKAWRHDLTFLPDLSLRAQVTNNEKRESMISFSPFLSVSDVRTLWRLQKSTFRVKKLRSVVSCWRIASKELLCVKRPHTRAGWKNVATLESETKGKKMPFLSQRMPHRTLY